MTDETEKPDEQEAPEPHKPGTRKISVSKWAEIEALVKIGTMEMKSIAAKYGITPEYLSRRMKKRGVKRGETAREHAQEVIDTVHRHALDDAEIVAKRIKETKERHYKYNEAIAKLAWSEVATCVQNKRPLASVGPNLKALRMAGEVFRATREDQYEILGMNDGLPGDEDLPELTIRELTADEITEMRERQAAADPNLIGQDLIEPEGDLLMDLGEIDDLDDEIDTEE